MVRASRYAEHRDGVLDEIASAQRRHAKPPSVRELAETFGVGVATMHHYLTLLADEGEVEWSPGRHRSLTLAPTASPRP